MTTKTRILAVCAAALLTFPTVAACTYHDANHDNCDPNATAIVVKSEANCAEPQP
jgi:hypothetical protein